MPRWITMLLERLLVALLLLSAVTFAQAPTGTITGTVTDPAGSAVANANITLTNLVTGFTRTAESDASGSYSFAAVPAGEYEMRANAQGFRILSRMATVETGITTTVTLPLSLGEISEKVTVESSGLQVQLEQSQIGGVVHRQQIENLPLNGRNFLELAKLEPGVTIPGRQSNNRTTVPILGAPRVGNLTRVTVDGGNISQIISAPGPVMGLSQEAVQEFQIATVNPEVATGGSGSGLVNIVTRSGSNELHGSAYLFFRDHHLSAYPALRRDPSNPDPFFQRRQWGGQVGGPIRPDRAFFFVNFETTDQRSVISVQSPASDFAALGGIFKSPYLGRQLTGRFDLNINQKNTGFVRYSHDNNRSFGPRSGVAAGSLPSNWSRLLNWVDQSLLGLTTVFSPRLVNDLGVSYFFASTPEQPPTAEDCGGSCIGLNAPQIIVPGEVTLGHSLVNSSVGRRYGFSDGLSWQKGSHRMRFGLDWEYNVLSLAALVDEPATLTLFSPERVRQYNATVAPPDRIQLPASFRTLDDILQLPLQGFVTEIGADRVMQPDFSKLRRNDRYRLYAQDVWRAQPRLTVTYGLGWSYEPHNLNYDLTRPAYLAPLIGADRLGPPQARVTQFAPSVGFAWSMTKDSRTVLRGGLGIYYEPQMPGARIIGERQALGPFGTGSSSFTGRNIDYTYNGKPLEFPTPTQFTGSQLLAILPGIRASLLQLRNPQNRDFSVRNIEVAKQNFGQFLAIYSPDFRAPYTIETSIGIQREIGRGIVVSADYVRRRFVHSQIMGIDLNHVDATIGRVLPKCTDAQSADPKALCSLGPINFDTSDGLATYNGLLVRVERRFPHRLQLLGSYALSTNVGTNGTGPGFNLFNWFENYGPLDTDRRHVLSVSGILDLPKKVQLSWSALYYSKPPFTVYLRGIDFNGDGTTNDLLPGTKANQFNRGLGKSDLARLVTGFNANLAGKRDARGTLIRPLTLPAHYDLNSSFFTFDQRISRTWAMRERWRITLLGEVFNLFNVANLGGYSNDINSPLTFGQPTTRVDQAFGSGGPRSFQLALKLGF